MKECVGSFRFRFEKLNQHQSCYEWNDRFISFSPGQRLENELHVPVPGDDPLQTKPHVRVALALHSVVADLLRGLQEAREHSDHWAQRGLEPCAATDQFLKQGDLDLGHEACISDLILDMHHGMRRGYEYLFLLNSFCWQSLKLLHYRSHYRTLRPAYYWCVLNWVKQMPGTYKSLWE